MLCIISVQYTTSPSLLIYDYLSLQDSEKWSDLQSSVMKRLPDTPYMLRDYQSSEIQSIVSSVSHKETDYQRKKMQILAEILDSYWDGRHRNELEALIYDSKNDAYLEASTVSSFGKFLVHQAWLPPKFNDGVLCNYEYDSDASPALYKGSDLFHQHSTDVINLLHSHVPYIGANLKCSEFIKHLKIQDSVTKNDLLERLICWSEKSQQHGGKFCTSIKHMSAVYEYLLGGRTYHHQDHSYEGEIDMIREKFTNDTVPLIFVPTKHVEESNRVGSDDVEGEFLSVHHVCWSDPTTVLYNKQKYNCNLPGTLPKILSLYYDCNVHLKSIFESVNIRHMPNIASLIAVLKYNASLAANPDRDTVNNFTSVALYLVGACREQNLNDSYLFTQLRSAKVFPSHKHVWVNLNEYCLLENDNITMAKFFRETEVHFLQWPKDLTQERKTNVTQQRNNEAKMELLRVLNISTLSTKVSVLVDPVMISPMDDLKEKLCLWLPLLQQFLQQKCPAQYAKLLSIKVNIVAKLQALQILAASDLKCQYYIEHEDRRLMCPEPVLKTCELEIGLTGVPVIYVAESKRGKSPGYLIDALLKLFMSDDSLESEERLFRDFLKDLFLGDPLTQEEVEDMTTRYELSGIREEDTKWDIPLPLRCQVRVEEIEDEDLMQANQTSYPQSSDAATGEEGSNEPKPLTSWPPCAAVDRTAGKKSGAQSSFPGECHSALTNNNEIGEDDIQEVRKKYIDGNNQDEKANSSSQAACLVSQVKQGRRNYEEDAEGGVYVATDCRSSQSELFPQPCAESASNLNVEREGARKNHGQYPFDQSMGHMDELTSAESANNFNVGKESGSGGKHGKLYPLDQSMEHMSKTSWQATIQPTHDTNEGGKTCLVDIQHIVDQLHDCKSPPLLDYSQNVQDQESLLRISRWGEEHVYTVLRASGELPNGRKIDRLVWVNEKQESGKPYDIEVVLVQGNGGTDGGDDRKEGEVQEGHEKKTVYIEVKSTVASEKAMVEISLNELKFAMLKSCDYHMYRVYGAGLTSSRLCLLENLHLHLHQKSSQILLYL